MRRQGLSLDIGKPHRTIKRQKFGNQECYHGKLHLPEEDRALKNIWIAQTGLESFGGGGSPKSGLVWKQRWVGEYDQNSYTILKGPIKIE